MKPPYLDCCKHLLEEQSSLTAKSSLVKRNAVMLKLTAHKISAILQCADCLL